MREIRSLLWKEWHESRLFLWIALALFIGLPIVGGFEGLAMYSHHFEFAASPWIIFCGPLLAMVVGVACTCRDLQAKLEDFWQSVPVGSIRLFAVKYCMALAIILLACNLPLAIEFFSISDHSTTKAAASLSLFWTAIFSTAFACGCIFRKPAHAAAVAVLAVLLIYFLPVVLPPLEPFNVGQLLDISPQSRAAAISQIATATFALSLLMAVIALLAVRFHWHIASEQPLIYGAASAAFLVLLESASYQLGTNLPILSSVALPDQIAGISVTGTSGRVIRVVRYLDPPDDDRKFNFHYFSRAFTVSNNAIVLGPELPLSTRPMEMLPAAKPANQRDPNVFYGTSEDEFGNVDRAILQVWFENGAVRSDEITPIELWRGSGKHIAAGYLHVWHDRLYVIGQRTIVFDITDPLQPKRLSDEPTPWSAQRGVLVDEEPTIELPKVPGMPSSERLRFALSVYDRDVQGTDSAFDGTIWCRNLGELGNGSWVLKELEALRLDSLTDDTARFALLARYQPTLVQRMFGAEYLSSLKLKNGLLYAGNYGLHQHI